MERLIPLERAARLLGVHPDTLRHWDMTGKVRVVRTPGGKRRVPESEILRLRGEVPPAEKRVLAVYGRVSSRDQQAKAAGKPLAVEQLDCAGKKARRREMSDRQARPLSSFVYAAWQQALRSRAARAGVEVLPVPAAFTSVLGFAKLGLGYGLSAHAAAAAAIARRGLRFGERLRSRSAFPLPVRHRGQHVWSDWRRVAQGLRAERARGRCPSEGGRGRGRPLSSAAAAVPQGPPCDGLAAVPGCESPAPIVGNAVRPASSADESLPKPTILGTVTAGLSAERGPAADAAVRLGATGESHAAVGPGVGSQQGAQSPSGTGAGAGLGLLAARIEAALFASAQPLTAERLARACAATPAQVRRALAELGAHLQVHGHGLELAEVAGGFQLLTRPEHADAVRALAEPRTPPLSHAALETLAVIAFRQPVTRAAVDEVRGVHSEGAIATLLERGLVAEEGRAEAPGRPYRYVTTRRFLEYFGLRSLDELAAADGLPASLRAGAPRPLPLPAFGQRPLADGAQSGARPGEGAMRQRWRPAEKRR